jgi:hypothetical protein
MDGKMARQAVVLSSRLPYRISASILHGAPHGRGEAAL